MDKILNSNIARENRNFPSCFKTVDKQIKLNGNLPFSNDGQTVRDLFIFSEKHCEPKSFKIVQTWMKGECERKADTGKDLCISGNFLRSLKTVASSQGNYKWVRSPEFKPGSYFLLPDKHSASFDYKTAQVNRRVPCCTYIESRNPLCQENVMRKMFCEVIGSEMCVDCNGGKLRAKFNNKVNSFYPFLEYDKEKRPYGYFPRALRLTEPLPLRIGRFPRRSHSQGRDHIPVIASRGIHSGQEKVSTDSTIQVFINRRPYTS